MIEQIEKNMKYDNIAMRNILIVDDDPEISQFLKIIFRSRGYRATSAPNMMAALNWVEYSSPDVIILDETMPEMTSCESYQRLHDRSDAPVVFLTTLSAGKLAAHALATGMSDFMIKPLPTQELITRVEAFLDNSQPQCRSSGALWQNRVISVQPTVSVIVPTYNEAKNLPLVLPFLPMDLIDEVILVDGRSTDGTVEVARKMLPSIRVVMEEKPGKGAALLAGYRASFGDILIVVDADGSNDPREIPRFIQALKEGADFVKGSRFAPGGGTTDMPRFRRLGNAGLTFLVNILFNGTFTDLCYGYHAFWRYSLDMLSLEDVNGFEIDTALYLQAMREHLKIREVPSFEGYRFFGEGKLRTIPDGWRVLRTILGEFSHNVKQPNRDLYLGFRGEPVADQEWFAVSIAEESLEAC